jgi:predicted dehydrogenase
MPRPYTRRAFVMQSAAASAALSQAFAASQSQRIRLCQIGTQHAHAAGKIASVRALLDLYDVVGLSDSEPSDAGAYKDLPRYSTDALLALPGLEVVNVETRVEDSCATALKVIQAGKHVHLDKPGALSHQEFKTMRLEAEKRGVIVQMGYMLRHNPAFELLFRAVREGWLGEITEIDAMMGKLANQATRKELRGLSGGGMFELGCHMMDAALTVMKSKPQKVYALSTPSTRDGTKDNQLAVLEYAKATVTLRCNHADPFGGPRRRFQVTGTKGSMEIMPMESGHCVLRLDAAHEGFKKGEQVLKLDVPKDRYVGEFTTLAKSVRGEMKFPWSAQHDIEVHETVMLASGQEV